MSSKAALEGAGVAATAVQTVDEVTAAEPDAVVMVVDETTADLIPALQDAGYVTGENRLYLVTGMADPALGFVVGDRPGVLEGVTVIQPGAEVDEDLRARLIEVDPSLERVTGAPEAYDAAVIAALASEAAGTDDPDFVAAEVPGVTRGGTTCTNFEECRRPDRRRRGHRLRRARRFVRPGRRPVADPVGLHRLRVRGRQLPRRQPDRIRRGRAPGLTVRSAPWGRPPRSPGWPTPSPGCCRTWNGCGAGTPRTSGRRPTGRSGRRRSTSHCPMPASASTRSSTSWPSTSSPTARWSASPGFSGLHRQRADDDRRRRHASRRRPPAPTAT